MGRIAMTVQPYALVTADSNFKIVDTGLVEKVIISTTAISSDGAGIISDISVPEYVPADAKAIVAEAFVYNETQDPTDKDHLVVGLGRRVQNVNDPSAWSGVPGSE